MSFDLTDLHKLIVRAHDRRKIPMGKAMRVILQAAANGKFPLYKTDGSTLELNVVRGWLLYYATTAEQQNKVRWWEKDRWPDLQSVLVSEPKFWSWLDGELGTSDVKVGKLDPKLSSAIRDLLKTGQPGRTTQWDEFCDKVRDNCDGWKDRKNRVPKRGFGDRTIKRCVNIYRREVSDKKNKEDK